MTPQTYSEFFFSGLRVMADMPHIQTVLGPEQAAPNALKASARYNILRGLARRPRPRRTRTSPSPASFMIYEPEKAAPPSSRKQRRSSIIDLPARLLGRMLQSMPDSWSLPGSACDRTRHAETEVYLSRASNSSYKIADPFGTSPCSSSFFTVDYAEEVPPVASAPPPRRTPNQRRRSVFEPIQHLRLPMIPRMRRHSTQSLPAPATVPVTVAVARPSRALQASFQIQADRVRLRPRTLDEEDMLSSRWSADSDLEHDGAPDPVGSMDWRQFHADLLREEL